MNLFDKAVEQAQRASKREKCPVFLHSTYAGIVMKYKHLGVLAQPTYMVNDGKIFDVTYNIENANHAKCFRYVEIY